jgi:hypothetical protein
MSHTTKVATPATGDVKLWVPGDWNAFFGSAPTFSSTFSC